MTATTMPIIRPQGVVVAGAGTGAVVGAAAGVVVTVAGAGAVVITGAGVVVTGAGAGAGAGSLPIIAYWVK